MASLITALRLYGSLTLLAAVFALAMGGCKSLPHIVPDLAFRSSAGVRLAGARGPLSAVQSQAALQRLAAHGEPTSIFMRHLALEEEVAGSPLTTGNDVVLLKDGPATYRAMLEAIETARDHIHLET